MRSICITLSADSNVEELVKKGNFNKFKMLIGMYCDFFDHVYLVSFDFHSFTNKFGYKNFIHSNIQPTNFKFLNVMIYFLKGGIRIKSISKNCCLIRALGDSCVHAVIGKYLSRKPLVVSYHYDLSGQIKRERGKIFGLLSSFVEFVSLRNADLIIALTKKLKNNALKITNNNVKIEVIPNGVDIKRFVVCTSKKNSNRKTLLFVGRIHPIKGLKYLVNALCILKNKCGIKLDLLIIGDGEYKKNLVSLVSKYNLNNQVFFLGSIDNNEIPLYYEKADIFVLPSLEEGMPNAILEAMASGVPIVAANVMGINDILTDNINALLFKKADHLDLANKICFLAENKENADQLALNALKLVKSKYDNQKIFEMELDLIKKFCS